MKHLATLTGLILLAMPLAPLSPVGAFDWHPSESGIYDGQIVDSGGDYYPLKVGDTWTYSAGGNQFVLKVVEYEQFAGRRCARVEMQTNGKTQSHEHIAVTSDGVYRVGFEEHVANPPVRMLKRSPQVGEQWQVNSVIGKETIKGTFKCGKEARLKVGNKVYDTVYTECNDLDANGMKVKFKTYYARSVGMVKQIITIGTQEVVIELEKFEPAK